MHSPKRGFTLIELLVVISIIAVLATIILTALGSSRVKSRDGSRISEIRQIRYALELYYEKFGQYPTCLSAHGTCTTLLAGSGFLATIPTDPSTGVAFSYAALGSGTNCSSYHLGISLEDKNNYSLLTDTDTSNAVTACTNSDANFHGLSYVAGGVACNTTGGNAQPNAVNGESCYDLGP